MRRVKKSVSHNTSKYVRFEGHHPRLKTYGLDSVKSIHSVKDQPPIAFHSLLIMTCYRFVLSCRRILHSPYFAPQRCESVPFEFGPYSRMAKRNLQFTSQANASLRYQCYRERLNVQASSSGPSNSAPPTKDDQAPVNEPSPSPPSSSTKPLLTLPTLLTLARVLAIPVLVLLWFTPTPWSPSACTAIFLLAAATDWLDGFLARRMNLSSAFGAFLDPVADKLMVRQYNPNHPLTAHLTFSAGVLFSSSYPQSPSSPLSPSFT